MSHRLKYATIFCSVLNGLRLKSNELTLSFYFFFINLIFSVFSLSLCFWFVVNISLFRFTNGHWMSAWTYQINGQAIHHFFLSFTRKTKTTTKKKKENWSKHFLAMIKALQNSHSTFQSTGNEKNHNMRNRIEIVIVMFVTNVKATNRTEHEHEHSNFRTLSSWL